MRRSQIRWIGKNVKNGGINWIIAEIGKNVYIVSGRNVGYINGYTEANIAAIAVAKMKRGENQQAAKILDQILTNPTGE